MLFFSSCICAGPESAVTTGDEKIVLGELVGEDEIEATGMAQGALYQQAYERAQAEINIDNAAKTLDAIDKAVRREREEYRHP